MAQPRVVPGAPPDCLSCRAAYSDEQFWADRLRQIVLRGVQLIDAIASAPSEPEKSELAVRLGRLAEEKSRSERMLGEHRKRMGEAHAAHRRLYGPILTPSPTMSTRPSRRSRGTHHLGVTPWWDVRNKFQPGAKAGGDIRRLSVIVDRLELRLPPDPDESAMLEAICDPSPYSWLIG